MIRSAIIGLGDISFVHLDAILSDPENQLAAACDLNEELRSRVPEGTPFFTDYREMVLKIRPDVVHVCLPHYLHYPVTKDLVEMGVDVFCEKPVALNIAQAEQFAALEEAHPERKICICLQNRMNETTEALKAIIDSGEYGAVTGVRGIVPWYRNPEYYSLKPWRGTWEYAGGGTMINQSLHTLDLGSGLLSIGSDAFSSCNALTEVTIPASVTSIGSDAFGYCFGLAACRMLSETPPAIEGDIFSEAPDDFVILVPASSVEAYKAAEGWSDYAGRIMAI